jgi:glycosyltransferase involved in cell wall biosynthesis
LDALTDAIRHVSSFDFVVAVSETTASQVKLRLGVPTERIVVTLEAPAMDLSCPCGEKPADLGDGIGETGYFLSVSRFDAKKNLQNMIRAFAKAKHECNLPEHLVLVGPKDEGRAELEAWVMASGADSDVRILPFVPEKGLLWLYHHATALLFPSFCEGFGLPILEAMACGCPVLTSDCSSMPEVAGRAACFVDPWSVDSMAEGIARLSLDASYRQSLRGAGLERVKEFTWEKAAERLVKGLEYALQNTRVRG